jgi:hypothetical protein
MVDDRIALRPLIRPSRSRPVSPDTGVGIPAANHSHASRPPRQARLGRALRRQRNHDRQHAHRLLMPEARWRNNGTARDALIAADPRTAQTCRVRSILWQRNRAIARLVIPISDCGLMI